jgi:hypothetical protein
MSGDRDSSETQFNPVKSAVREFLQQDEGRQEKRA